MSQINNCIYCKNDKIVKNGLLKSGGQRFRCRNCKRDFSFGGFTETYTPEFKENICKKFLHNCDKVREIANIYNLSTSTIIARSKGHKKNCIICK